MKNPHRPALLLALLLAATLPVQAQTAVPAAPKVPAKPASAPELALKACSMPSLAAARTVAGREVLAVMKVP